MSLRSRLVAIVLLLTAAGLLASAIATPRLLRSYLLRRVDDRLEITGSITAVTITGRMQATRGIVIRTGMRIAFSSALI